MAAALDFARLTRIIEVAQADAGREMGRERAVALLLTAFHTDDPTLSAPLDAWVTQVPSSWVARLARTEHGLAKAERGHSVMPVPTVIDDTTAALRVDARLALAYVQATRAYALAASGGDTTQCRATAARGLAQLPGDLQIREALVACLLGQAPSPARDHEVEQSGVGGALDWDRARRTTGPAALALYAPALSANAHWWYYRDRATAYLDYNRPRIASSRRASTLSIRSET